MSFILQTVGVLAWRWEPATNEITWDGDLRLLFGEHPATFVATYQDYERAIHDDDRDQVLAWRRRVMTGQERFDVQYRVVRPDGSIHFIVERGMLVGNDAGRPAQVVGLCWEQASPDPSRTELEQENRQLEQEIHERQAAQAELGRLNEQLSLIIEHQPVIPYTCKAEGDYSATFISKRIQHITGYKPEQLLEDPSFWAERIHPDDRDRVFADLAKLFECGGQEHEYRWRISDGTYRYFYDRLQLVRDDSGQPSYIVGVWMDITERKQAEMELAATKERAEQASAAKSSFLASVSHDIRTPLNAVLGYSQILKRYAARGALPPDLVESIENIHLSARNLSDIIDNTLELSKIEEGKLSISDDVVNLGLLAREVFQIAKMEADEKGVVLQHTFDSELPDTVITDRTKLTQILINLISNAIKFTPAQKHVDFLVGRRGQMMHFAVKDEGIGIAKDKQALIFEPFEQADSTIARSFGGSGLGLAITRRLCEAMDGRVWLDSEPGIGATFHVELPLRVTDVIAGDAEDSPAHGFARDVCVLVVEDNPINQKMMTALFAALDIDIHIAEDGRSGVEMARELRPECIFMDLQMPEMNGFEATRQIRQIPELADTPIVALSADAFSEQRQAAYEAGITDYLTKPLFIDKLVPVLNKYLRRDTSTGDHE